MFAQSVFMELLKVYLYAISNVFDIKLFYLGLLT